MSKHSPVVFHRSLLNAALVAVFTTFSASALAVTVADCSAIPGNPATLPYLAATITSVTIGVTPLVNNNCVNVNGPGQAGISANGTSQNIIATDTPNQLYVVTTGGNGYGVNTSVNRSVALHNVDIYNSGPVSFSLFAQPQSTISSDGLINIDTTGGGNNTRGVDSDGVGTSIQLTNVSILTSGNRSYGIDAEVSSLIHVSGTTTIDTSFGGSQTYGVFADSTFGSGSSIVLDGAVDIKTGGDTSFGMYANAGSTITTNAGLKIDTSTVAGLNTSGVRADGAGASITLNGTNFIKTGGDTSRGIRALNGGVVNVTGIAPDITTGYVTTVDTGTALGNDTTAVYASGGSSAITFAGSLNVISGGKDSAGLKAELGGTITTNAGVKIDTATTIGTGTFGVYATGAGALVTLAGVGSTTTTNYIQTGGDDSFGLYALNGGIIKITGASSTTTGIYTTVIDTSSSGVNTVGVKALGAGAQINIANSVAVMTGGNNSYGIEANSGGVVNLSDKNKINTEANVGDYTYGAYATGAGSIINFNGGGAADTATNNLIDTGGNSSYGLFAENGGVININGVSSTTAGVYTSTIDTTEQTIGQTSDNTVGVYADGGGSIINVNSSISIATGGTLSDGVQAANSGTVNFNDVVDINTGYGTSTDASGVYVTGAGSSVNFAKDVTLMTDGAGSNGFYAVSGGVINSTGGKTFVDNLKTTSGGELGFYASGIGSVITVGNSEIITRGAGSSGVRADAGGQVNLQGTASIDVSGAGVKTYGVHVLGAGSVVTLGGAGSATNTNNIMTGGDDSFGIYAEAGGVVNITGAASGTSGVFTTQIDTSASGVRTIGIVADGGGSTVTFANGGSVLIKTGGNDSHGVVAEDTKNTGLGSKVIFSGAVDINTETTPGINTFGAFANGAGSVITFAGAGSSATTNVVDTGGDGSYGLYALNGGVINFTGASSTAAGVYTTEIDTSEGDIGGISNDTVAIYADGAGSQINFSNSLVISTSGDKSYGIYALGGGVVTNTSLTSINSIGTVGNTKIGVYASGADSSVTLADTQIMTRGTGSSGIRADLGGLVTINGETSIDTAGDSNDTIGVHATDAGSTVNLNGANIVTGGTNSHGLAVDNGGVIYINGAVHISTSGDGAAGVLIDDTLANSGVSIDATSSDNSITTTGANAHGVAQINDSSTNIEHLANLTINTSGVGSDAFNIDPDQLAITTNITNSFFTAQQGNGIGLIGGNRTMNLDASSITSVNGYGVNASQNTLFDLNLNNASLLDGAIIQDATSSVNLNIDSSSVWRLQKDSTLQQLNNSGTVSFTNRTPGFSNSTLTVLGDYVGNNGLIQFNAALASDDSLTDFMLVKGATSGNSDITVQNVNGPGAQTVNGLKIIEVAGASDGVFTLKSRAVAGPYEYYLFQGTPTTADGDWYLRSEYDSKLDVMRPAVGSYLANINLSNTMFVHSLHERLGETMYASDLCGCKDLNGSAWARVSGYTQGSEAANGQIDISSNVSLLQAGVDLIKWKSDKSRIQGGVMFGAGQANSVSHVNLNGMRADSGINAYAVGIYGTWYGAGNERNEGPYVDSWFQYGSFDNNIRSSGLDKQYYDTHNWQASIEGGYAIALTHNPENIWYIEPQAQFIYTDSSTKDIHENNGTHVKDENGTNWTMRAGLRLYARIHFLNGMKVKPFVEANWLHEQNIAAINMGNQFVNATVDSDLPKDRGEIKFGAETELAKNWNVWWNLGYQQGSNGYRQTEGNIGVKYLW